MKNLWKAASTVFSLVILSACSDSYGGYYNGYYGGGIGAFALNNGYCDSFGCPSNYWDLPVYYGSVYFNGAWVNGPFYYRNWSGRQQYWLRGSWREDSWRGARPNQYRVGRYGPALGRDFYQTKPFAP